MMNGIVQYPIVHSPAGNFDSGLAVCLPDVKHVKSGVSVGLPLIKVTEQVLGLGIVMFYCLPVYALFAFQLITVQPGQRCDNEPLWCFCFLCLLIC